MNLVQSQAETTSSNCIRYDPLDGLCAECRPRFFLSFGNCYPCMEKCNACFGKDNCFECEDGLYFSSVNCAPCSANCLECKNLASCSLCKEDYFLFDNECYYAPNCMDYSKKTGCLECVSGYYVSPSTNRCTPCSQNCKLCNEYSCIQCADGYFKIKGICKIYNSNCLTCSYGNECTSCKEGFFLNNETCYEQP